MKRFELGPLALIACLLCASIAGLRGMGNPPEIFAPVSCTDDSWTAHTTISAPDPRFFHTAVWTGTEMIIWGGANFDLGNFNTGARYNPATDTWTAISTANAPTARGLHSAVWTGSEVIVWGGGGDGQLDTGGRYNPTDDSWTATSTANAPLARNYHTAVWTGSEMIVWGGSGCGGNCKLNTGGRYNPSTNSWTATSTMNAPEARFRHKALWTGSEMIIWGGSNQTNYLRTGARYNPRTDTWTPTQVPNTTIPGRYSFAAVWSGSEMIVWGGVDETFHGTSTGGRYNPINDGWVATNLANAPSPRSSHTGVWIGSEMIIWGGGNSTAALSTGGRYNSTTDSWIPTTTMNAPVARDDHTAVWTGTQMMVWGGFNNGGFEENTGGRYCAQPSTPLAQSAVSRKTHGNAGSLDINLPLSGTPGIECRSGGATSDYTIAVTFLANVSVNGNPQAAVASGVGTIGSGGVSNGGMVIVSDNVVTIPLTNVATAQTITVTLHGVNGTGNVMIPMSLLVGDTNGDRAVNSGDTLQTRNRAGQATDPTNFRSDVNADGAVNSGDTLIVRARSGNFLP